MTAPAKLACPECDLMLAEPSLRPGERALCPRCGFQITRCFADPFNRALSLAVSALVALVIAFGFRFLTMSRAGVENSMTLFETVSYLASYGAEGIATLVFLFVVLVPAIMLVFIIMIALALHRGDYPDWMLPVTRWLFHMNGWAMVEVFAIGVIVSLVKLANMARIELGLSFYAYLVFAVLFLAAFSSLDRLTVWTSIERLRRKT